MNLGFVVEALLQLGPGFSESPEKHQSNCLSVTTREQKKNKTEHWINDARIQQDASDCLIQKIQIIKGRSAES